MYSRIIKKAIISQFYSGKAIIITGPRQVGKTTLSLEIINEKKGMNAGAVRVFNCDNPTDRQQLNNKDIEFLRQIIGDARIVFIDEGQKVPSIGQTLKLLVDHYGATKQILVTGSSSIHLLNETAEPLTGRKYVHALFPLSLEEIHPDRNYLDVLKGVEERLVFGNYPDVLRQTSFEAKRRIIEELASSYLYKDILELRGIRHPDVLDNLLRALALQVGAEVSYSELSRLLGVQKATIERYIDLLEKSYVIFRLKPYTSNRRKEISKLKKIYFYDLGVRNALIQNFNFLNRRDDVLALWENFLIVERLKYRAYHSISANMFFWRTYDGSEVDLVEEREGKLFGYECKWNEQSKRRSAPALWADIPQSTFAIISKKDLQGFVF